MHLVLYNGDIKFTYFGVQFIVGDINSDVIQFYRCFGNLKNRETMWAKKIDGAYRLHHESEPSIKRDHGNGVVIYEFHINGNLCRIEDLPCDDVERLALALRYSYVAGGSYE